MRDLPDNYYQLLCEHLGFVCVAVDTDLRIEFWNEHASRQFGQNAESMIGRSILEVIPEPQRDAAREVFTQTMTARQAGEFEIKIPTTETPTTLVVIVSPIIDHEGACIGASAGMRDISVRKKMSQELSRSRRMAALGDVAGAVAHHFNNILGGMQTSIDTVMSSESPRELRRVLRQLSDAIGRATRITHQLAAFAESDNVQLEFVELNPLLTHFIELVSKQAAHLGIEIVTRIDEIASRKFETTRLMPVLESIAQNAFDAMSGGGRLTIEMAQNGRDAVITMTDTGAGMSEEVQERVFEPFFTTKVGLGGGASDNIGLGMAAVHGLVSEMGGTISIKSREGQGTRVQVRLPLERRSEGGPLPGADFKERRARDNAQ
jgi:PAS domain S-box-containing protein